MGGVLGVTVRELSSQDQFSSLETVKSGRPGWPWGWAPEVEGEEGGKRERL